MALKLKTLVKFPALVEAITGLAVAKANGVYTFLMDWLSIGAVDTVADLTTRSIVVVSGNGSDDQLYERLALDKFLGAISGAVQEIATSGAHDVNVNAAVVKVDPSLAGAVTLNMPAAVLKQGPVLVIDWAQGAGTHAITIMPEGSEAMNGLSSWSLAADGAGATFYPIPGAGYAVR